MKAKLRFLLLLFAPVIALLALGGIWLRTTGLSARPQPGLLETAAARQARRFAIPRAARELKNPMELTADALTEARSRPSDAAP